MSDLPARVIVGPYTYTVEGDKDFTDSHNAWAHIQYGRQRIAVDDTATPDRLRVAVLHEVLHAIHEQTDSRGEKWEEKQVTQDAPVLLDVLQRNPTLVAFLLDGAT